MRVGFAPSLLFLMRWCFGGLKCFLEIVNQCLEMIEGVWEDTEFVHSDQLTLVHNLITPEIVEWIQMFEIQIHGDR